MPDTAGLQGGSMTLADDRIRVFISYAHQDAQIALALKEALIDTNNARVECFVDRTALLAGDNWAQKIEDRLRESDWLIFIYHEGRSLEYPVYELGMFRALHGLNTHQDNPSHRLFTIHDVEPLPILLQSVQNRKVLTGPLKDDLQRGRNLTQDETSFYADSPLGRFFDQFARSPARNPLVPPSQSFDDDLRFRTNVARRTRSLAIEFQLARINDLKYEVIYENRIEILIAKERFWEQGEIPPGSVISGKEDALKTLGYAGASQDGSVRITWSALREHYRQSSAIMPWLDAVESEIVGTGKNRSPRGEIIVFKSSYDSKIYRPIIARQEVFHNGSRKFFVLFIQTLERHFAGEPRSSTLLAATVMASRCFFRLFEEGDLAARCFASNLDDEEFDAACQQLVYDLDRMEHESSELGITDPEAVIAALGEQHRALIDMQYMVWKEQKLVLFTVLRARLRPNSTTERIAVEAAIRTFTQKIERHNRSFLSASLNAFHVLMQTRLAHGGAGR